MKIYLAATAPGNETKRERGMIDIDRRLLSFYFLYCNLMETKNVFNIIKNENILSRGNDCNEL